MNASESSSESQSTSYTNSSLSGGNVVSNSDSLTLEGGNIYGDSVVINTGELDITSLQDTAQSESESVSAGVSIGISYGFTDTGTSSSSNGSISYNESNTQSNYASVNQQSGISTGDGGYQINVSGNTNLVGGLITSSGGAEAAGNNSLSTGTLTQSDLENHAEFSGDSFGVNVNISETESGDYGISNTMGYGDTAFSQTSTTNSGINTANITITDGTAQQALTGETVDQTIANIATDTTTETAELDSGALNNNFNQADVEEFVNAQQVAAQSIDKGVTQVKNLLNNQMQGQKEKLGEQLEKGEITPEQYDDGLQSLANYSLLLNTVSAAITTPTDSVAGQFAAAASPAASYAIGQYFKSQAASNENGQLSGGEEAAHVLAHGILAAAIASAGGNDALTAGVAAGASEAVAPLLSQWLYGEENGSNLTADQKETLGSILSLGSIAIGATTGDMSDAVAAGVASETAVENNNFVAKAIIPIAEVALPRVVALLGSAAAGAALEDQIEALKNTPEYEEMNDQMKVMVIGMLTKAFVDGEQGAGGKQIHEGNVEDNILISPAGESLNLEGLVTGFPINEETGAIILTGSDGETFEIPLDGSGGYQAADDLGLGLVYSESGEDNRPINLTPDNAGRSGAFNEAKRNSGIPVSQQPIRVDDNIDRRGNIQPGRVYVYEVPDEGGGTKIVTIRDDTEGHYYGENDSQNRDSHFNDEQDGHYDY